MSITALGTHKTPINSVTDAVFIPRLVDSVCSSNVFAVLIAAATACKSRVVTDVLGLDTNNDPIVPSIDSSAFPDAAVAALRILGANMIASNQGPLFALSFTRGIHKCMDVEDHGSGGHLIKQLLRAGGQAKPFGGIHFGLDHYAALPALTTSYLRRLSVW